MKSMYVYAYNNKNVIYLIEFEKMTPVLENIKKENEDFRIIYGDQYMLF